MDVERYVPDISAFFAGEKRLTVEDMVELPVIRQETVPFKRNDLYEMTKVPGKAPCTLQHSKKSVKRRRRRKFRRS